MPTVVEAFALALQHHRAGSLRQAEELYRQILQTDPGHADSYHLLGVLACQAGQHEQAVACICQAVALAPHVAVYHANLGVAYDGLGHLENAIASLRNALRLCPENVDAHYNLANVLRRQKMLDEAVTHYNQALQLDPDHAAAHCNLGLALAAQGNLDEALLHYQEALRRNPKSAETYNNLGMALTERGCLDEAVASFQQALAITPDFAPAHHGLGCALQKLNRLDEAVCCYRRAIQLDPHYSQACNNLGLALEQQDKLDEAGRFFRQALQVQPAYTAAHYNLGIVQLRLEKLNEAIDCFRRALQFKEDFADALNNLGCALSKQGNLGDAMASFRRALALQPDAAPALSNLVSCLNYDPLVDLDEVFAEHCRWGRLHHPALPLLPHANDPDPQRRLRIGYVSPDFRDHTLMRYIEPVLAHHDAQQVEVFCYAEVQSPDATTARLQKQVHGWRCTCRLSDDQVAQLIRDDQIDILVDLAGHTANSRLAVFAQRPAPVEASWLGYMNTTGLATMDYRLTDAVLDPPGQLTRDTEELFRLPAGMCCFQPPADAPALTLLPASHRAHVTFGSLHGLIKINSKVLDLWSKVLLAVPGSRLLMFHHTLTLAVQEELRQLFSGRNIAAERIDLRLGTSAPGYLGVYSEIDIGLDTFPCTGGVTTCECLWMGVPVLSLCGVRPAGRNSAAVLARVGLSDWVVQTETQYVERAVRAAGDLERLAELRAGLRQRMTATLCDAENFTRLLEEAYREFWRRWCTRPKFPPAHGGARGGLHCVSGVGTATPP